MAPECVVCGTETPVSDACPHCGAACCTAHQPPEAHDCPGTDAGDTSGWRLDLDGRDGSDGDRPSEPLSSLFRPGIGLAVLTLLVVVAALAAVAWGGPLGGDLDTGAVEDHIEDRSDEKRVAADVGETRHDATLAAVARNHSRDMRDRGFVNHTNPDGEDPEDRVRAAGLDCLPGENIYQAPRGALASSEAGLADHVVRSWMDSPGHRRTLLRERYTRQGVGVAVGDDAVYVTQLFC
ncbi:CAP domain-containing protein [Natronomonas amylolytica]|uniref:CAP domain-containing protein n=1 Tax=Natronomonas amylolytica TaxID=3108498 RepID=UPI003007F50F